MARKNHLRKIRKSKKITLTQLSEKVGCTQPTVTRHEKSEIEMTVSQLYAYAAALDCHVMDILEGPSCN
ncbi:MAG: helix-turn-helix transcriptional regulator [Alphaproteobacteria bacterium]|nr:helix-turn-helix transcriptional regulator [Alphaproteobacteria bacterium]